MKKKILTVSITVVLVLVTAFFAVSAHLRIKYPEYYNLDTFKGIEVYVWQDEDGEYRCGAMSGTNRGKTIEELTALAENSVTIKEMKSILSSYKIEKDSIIIQVMNPLSGDVEATFMNKKEYEMNYYWGESYGAVQMFLENGSYMWFILPDEGKTVDDVLASDEYMEMITQKYLYSDDEKANRKWMKVNLSVPQFDVSAGIDLKPGLQSAGLNKVFDWTQNGFASSLESKTSEYPVYLDSIHQDTRVKIDEKGVVAASYIELNFGAGAAMPPDEIIDFVLDRPFVFAVTKSQIPLFVGTVNMP